MDETERDREEEDDEGEENERVKRRRRKANERERKKGGESAGETEGGTHRCKLISKKPEKEGNARSFVEGERTV